LNPWLPPCERGGGERHANLHLRSSRRTVRGEVRWRDEGDHSSWAFGHPDRRPHPYHGSEAHRHAIPRRCRSRATVWGHFGTGRYKRIPAPTDVITRAPRASDQDRKAGVPARLRAGPGLMEHRSPAASVHRDNGRGRTFRLRAGRGSEPVGWRGCGRRRRACGRSTWPGTSPCAATGAGAGRSRGRSGGWTAAGGAAARRW
jgi:hypothetical protein